MTGKIVGDRYYVDGQEVTEEEFWKAFPPRPAQGGGDSLIGWKPLKSSALAVHPNQVKEATEHAASLGVPTEFQKDGRPIFRSRQHRKEYCRFYGFHDKDAGYGDAQPGQTKRDVPDQPTGEALRKLYFD